MQYGIVEPPHGPGAAPEVSELPVTVQVDRVPDDVVADIGLVDVGADDKGVVSFGKPAGKLLAQPVCFLRRDLSGDKGLAQVVGDHIVLAAHPAGLLDVPLLCK